MKPAKEKFQVVSKDVQTLQSGSKAEVLQKRSTSDELFGSNKNREGLILTPVSPLSEQLAVFNQLKILKKKYRSETVIIKIQYQVFLTMLQSLKTGLFSSE